MATQIELAAHLDLSTRRVRDLLRDGILPPSKGNGGYDIDASRVNYIRHLRGLASGQQRGSADDDTQRSKNELELRELELKVAKLEKADRNEDRRWVKHLDHCSAIATLLAVLKENLQHYSVIAGDDVVDVCRGDRSLAAMTSELIVDAVVVPSFNDLAGIQIDNAIYDVYTGPDDDDEDD